MFSAVLGWAGGGYRTLNHGPNRTGRHQRSPPPGVAPRIRTRPTPAKVRCAGKDHSRKAKGDRGKPPQGVAAGLRRHQEIFTMLIRYIG